MADPEDRALSAELVDEITEAVVKPTDARVRAKVISELVHEVDEAVKWRHQRNPDGQEERSLGDLVDAAQAHQERMNILSDQPDEDSEPDQDPEPDQDAEPKHLPRRAGARPNGATAL